jgi:hypothetical protein
MAGGRHGLHSTTQYGRTSRREKASLPPASRRLSPEPGHDRMGSVPDLRVCQPVCPRLKILAQLLPARLPHLAVSEHQAVIASQGGPRVLAVPALPGGQQSSSSSSKISRDGASWFRLRILLCRPSHIAAQAPDRADASWLAADTMPCHAMRCFVSRLDFGFQ